MLLGMLIFVILGAVFFTSTVTVAASDSAIADLVGWVEQSETQQQIDKAIMD